MSAVSKVAVRADLAANDRLRSVTFSENRSVPVSRVSRELTILQNLVDNAEKFSRSAREHTIRVLLQTLPDGPTLSVVDHGVGVPASARRRIFEPFARGQDPNAPPAWASAWLRCRRWPRARGARVSYSDIEGG